MKNRNITIEQLTSKRVACALSLYIINIALMNPVINVNVTDMLFSAIKILMTENKLAVLATYIMRANEQYMPL